MSNVQIFGLSATTKQKKRIYRSKFAYLMAVQNRIRFSAMAAENLGIAKDGYLFFIKSGDSVYVKASKIRIQAGEEGIPVHISKVGNHKYFFVKMHFIFMKKLFPGLKEASNKVEISELPERLMYRDKEIVNCYKMTPV